MTNHIFALGLALSLIAGCGGDDTSPVDGSVDGSATDGAVDGSCMAAACGPADCGMVDDGCGGTLDCGACGCTDDNAETACPSRPCEVASCDAGACAYEPVTCDFDQCVCPAGGCASDDEPRACGAGCAATVCSPEPMDVAGRTVYANSCVPRIEVQCGLCNLGAYECGAGDALECAGVTFPWIDPATAECNGASAVSTLVYVDALVEGVEDGSRDHPFRTVADAVAAAILRDSRVIVVGRSLVTEGTFTLPSGISILGGYTGWPNWHRTDAERPIFRAAAADLASGRLVGVIAADITMKSRLQHVRVETADLTAADGASNAGVLVRDSPMLELVDVEIQVGIGAPGAPAAPTGAVVQGGTGPGAAGQGYYITPVTSACSTVVAGGAGGTRTCDGASVAGAAGGTGASNRGDSPVEAPDYGGSCCTVFWVSGLASPAGIAGGKSRYTGALGSTIVWGVGATGTTGRAGDAGASGVSAVSVSSGFPSPTGAGAQGSAGSSGTGGGGGSSGQLFRSYGSGASCRAGGGGGGGAAGGCGGRGGAGGGAGGWSYGVVVIGDGTSVVLEDVAVAVSAGGLGGTGAAGGAGLGGGSGGDGGAIAAGRTGSHLPSSSGGAGGMGGMGGMGGAGATGKAIGVYSVDATLVTTGVTSIREPAAATFPFQEVCADGVCL